MARVNLLITARDMTGEAFRRIGERARRLDRDFTRVGSNGNAGEGFFRALGRGFRRIGPDLRRGFADGFRGVGTLLRDGLRGGAQGAMAAMRGIANGVTSVLNSAFNTQIPPALAGAISAAAPLVVAAVAFIAGLVGATIAGAVTLAFGGAFVALGAMIAAKSVPVKNAWKRAADEVKTAWKGAGDALIPVILHAIGLMRKLSDSFLPHFKEAMRGAAGPLSDFLDNVAKGIKDFGKRAFAPMMDGFNALLLAFGPQFDSFMQGLGDSFGALGRTVASHSGEIALALRMILGLITTIVDIVNFLAQLWAGTLRVITAAFGDLIVFGIRPLFDAIMFLATNAVHGFALAFGWIPGIGGKIKKADKAFSDWAKGTSEHLNRIGNAARDWGKKMDAANHKRTLQVNISKWTNDLAAAKKDLKDTLSQKAQQKLKMEITDWTAKLAKAKTDLLNTTKIKAKNALKADITDLQNKIARAKQLLADQSRRKSKSAIRADISQLERQIAAAKRDLNNLNGKTVTTYVVNYTQQRNAGYAGNSATGGRARGGIIGYAQGGLVRASAAARSVLVGEEGPELVNLPPGARVNTAGATRGMMGQGNGPANVTLTIRSGGGKVDNMLVEILRHAVRVRGGNVQFAVMGKG